MESFSAVWEEIIGILKTDYLKILLDVAIITFLVYNVIILVRQTRAVQLLKGIALLVIASLFANYLELRALQVIMENVLQISLIGLLIVFQPELRRALEQFGRTDFISSSIFGSKKSAEHTRLELNRAIANVCDAIERMSALKIGALIVFERNTSLMEVTKTGTRINSDITVEVLGTIFYDGTPLHDGAVVITDARINAAGCFLPLSANLEISKDLGTRHRAGLGMSEKSDAIVVIASEETGVVSLAKNGVLIRRLDRQSLYNILVDDLLPKIVEEKTRKKIIRRTKNEKQ